MQKSLLRKRLGFEGNFTQIPNAWVRDDRIGFRAKGILTLLMSHQDGWRISLEALADGQDGITAIRTAVTQLEENGYLNRQYLRNDKKQIEATEWIISDPFENLISENLISENLTSGNHTHKNNNINNNINKNTINTFEQFWEIYPRKIGKGAARKAWLKISKTHQSQTLLDAVSAYAQHPDLPEVQYIPHPSTWLNQERWMDDLSSMGKANATSVAADILQRSKQMQGQISER
ncbi:MAG: hypothetical protein WDZ94_01795 [Patescibacteria group bacterium]